jgi:hypothetical protein
MRDIDQQHGRFCKIETSGKSGFFLEVSVSGRAVLAKPDVRDISKGQMKMVTNLVLMGIIGEIRKRTNQTSFLLYVCFIDLDHQTLLLLQSFWPGRQWQQPQQPFLPHLPGHWP